MSGADIGHALAPPNGLGTPLLYSVCPLGSYTLPGLLSADGSIHEPSSADKCLVFRMCSVLLFRIQVGVNCQAFNDNGSSVALVLSVPETEALSAEMSARLHPSRE